ncbi:MAG: HEPN domain-containing protein [Bacteroidales bacterium]|nr:HEPN domain-containing protein [Bacteroidales bacterium]
MSLSDEERTIVVGLEIEKAYVAYDETTWLIEKKSWSGAAGRLYYALFHAVSALLIHDHHQVSSHKGSHILFGNYYIKTGILPTEYGALYSQMESIREEGEYNCTYKVTEEELLKRLAPAKEMIDRIAEMVKE